MLFAIIAQDVEHSLSARLEARPAHVERLKELDSQNRLTLAAVSYTHLTLPTIYSV